MYLSVVAGIECRLAIDTGESLSSNLQVCDWCSVVM